MGIIKYGLLGPFRKKAGSVVGRRHRKQNVMTGLHNVDSTKVSAKQGIWRDKFGMLSSFLSGIEPLVTPGFEKYAKNMTSVNAAQSFNSPHAYRQEGEDWGLDYPKLMYSRGDVRIPESPQLSVADHSITFSWLAQPQSEECQYSDMASFLIYNATKKTAITVQNAVNRHALQFTQDEIPVKFTCDILHCYMSFASADGRRAGNSLYLGSVVV